MVFAFIVASFFMGIENGDIPPNAGFEVTKSATE